MIPGANWGSQWRFRCLQRDLLWLSSRRRYCRPSHPWPSFSWTSSGGRQLKRTLSVLFIHLLSGQRQPWLGSNRGTCSGTKGRVPQHRWVYSAMTFPFDLFFMSILRKYLNTLLSSKTNWLRLLDIHQIGETVNMYDLCDISELQRHSKNDT